jgi:hypothetical protein
MDNKIHPQLKKAIIESLSMEPEDKIFSISKESKYTRTYGEIIESIENETDEGARVANDVLRLTIDLLGRNVDGVQNNLLNQEKETIEITVYLPENQDVHVEIKTNIIRCLKTSRPRASMNRGSYCHLCNLENECRELNNEM